MSRKIDLSSALGIPPLPNYSPDTISALLWAREVLQKHLTTTYAVRDPKGIEELKSVKIGGIDQWLHIRGRNRSNPVLLYLHGGPGSPMIGYMDAIMRPWEDYFTIVHWDQRQTGKSYYPVNDESEPLTVQQMINDTEEVVGYLRSHLRQDKIFVLGHSWGSVLGMHMAKLHPDWLHAYIGVGQVVDSGEGERVLYERLCHHAREKKDEKLLAELKAIAPYPDPDNLGSSVAENTGFVRKELARLAGEANMRYTPFDDLLSMINFDRLISPHLTFSDIGNAIYGGSPAFCRPPYTFTEEVKTNNLPRDLGYEFEVPIFFFTGEHDWQTPKILSDKWFAEIRAPHKELLCFGESSHFVVNEEPGKVLVALVTKVLPMADFSAMSLGK